MYIKTKTKKKLLVMAIKSLQNITIIVIKILFFDKI